MDKTAKTIIGVATGIIYIILIVFGAILVFPSQQENLSRPTYPNTKNPSPPNCTRSNKNYSYNSDYDDYCKKLWDEYESDSKYYEKKRSEEVAKYDEQLKIYNQELNKVIILRSFLILTLALATLFVAFIIRHIWELAGGLVFASGLLVSGSVIVLASNIDKTTYDKAINVLILASFIIMTVLLKVIEGTVFSVEISKSPSPVESDRLNTAPATNQTSENIQNSSIEKETADTVGENTTNNDSDQSSNSKSQESLQNQNDNNQGQNPNQGQ